jgi:hypothetical protein
VLCVVVEEPLLVVRVVVRVCLDTPLLIVRVRSARVGVMEDDAGGDGEPWPSSSSLKISPSERLRIGVCVSVDGGEMLGDDACVSGGDGGGPSSSANAISSPPPPLPPRER